MPILDFVYGDVVHARHKVVVLLAHIDPRQNEGWSAGVLLQLLNNMGGVQEPGSHKKYVWEKRTYYVLFCRDDKDGWMKMPGYLRDLLAGIRFVKHRIIAVEEMNVEFHPVDDVVYYEMMHVLGHTKHHIHVIIPQPRGS